MTPTLNYIINDQTIWVWLVDASGQKMSGTFLKEEDPAAFGSMESALKNKQMNKIKELVSLKFDLIQAITTFGDGKINFQDGDLFYVNEAGDTNPIDTKLTAKIKDLIRTGGNAEVLVRFLDNLVDNPCKRAQRDFYDFMIVNNLAMTEDGHFLAYKIVGHNFKDLYTGKMDNSPGKVVSIDRSQVDNDPNRTCSHGLHICSKDYLPQYGGFYGKNSPNKILVVKVNPKDVVAFPKDYNNAKARVASYAVVGEFVQSDAEYLKEQIAKIEAGVTVDIEKVKKLIAEAQSSEA
jgi:hypothetical protein